MRYIDESLADGEIILRRGKFPAVFWVGAWAALILLGIIVVGVFIFLAAAIHMWTTDFAVTNRRVVLKRGWLNRRTQELAVENVEGVSLDQSIIGRLFGFGRVIVTGTGDATIVFPPTSHPIDFRRAIEQARAECGETRVVREERVVDETVNDNVEERITHEKPPRRRRSFIGLRSR